MRLPAPHRVPMIPLVGAIAAAVVVGLLAAPAAAHVTVHSDDPIRGASDAVVTFQVPNERADATVTRLEVEIPTAPPLLGVLVRPHPGWTSTVTMTHLSTPVRTEDGPVTQAVSLITWVASSPAAAIPAGGYDDFDLSVGQLPTTSTVTFKAVQSYSNGAVARWIAPTAAGQPEPADPAPTLHLSPGPATSGGPTSGGAGAGAAPAATAAPTGTVNGTSSSVPAATTVIDTSRDTTARVVAVIALVLALVGTVGGYLAGRRTVGRGGSGAPEDPTDDAPPVPAPRDRRLPPEPTAPAAFAGTVPPGRSSTDPTADGRGGRWSVPGWSAADRVTRRFLAAAAAGALAVGVAAFLPWIDGTLSDRGVPLLTTHKYGVTNPLRGRWTLLLAAVALVLIALLAISPAWKTRALVLAAVGLGVVALALSGRPDRASVARELIHHKIGTGEIADPTSSSTIAYGWWITVAGGLLMSLAALGWYRHARRTLPDRPGAAGQAPEEVVTPEPSPAA